MMRRILQSLPAMVLMLTAATMAWPQKEKSETESKGLLKIPVWIEADNGQFWLDGNRQFFKVFVDDRESTLKSFQGPRSPMILLIVFDTVADLARVDQARTSLVEAINKLRPNQWVGLMRAQDGLSVIQEPTADHNLLAEKIKSIQVSGKAGLMDTLEPVSTLAAGIMRKANVRLCVLYVTDSGVANYRADYLNPVVNSSDSGDLSRRFSDRAIQERMSRMTESLSRFTVPIFILHLEYRTDSTNLAYQSGLERIASTSGGVALFSRTSDDVASSLESLLKRIQASYFLGVETDDAKRGNIKLRVEVRKTDGNLPGKISYREQINLTKK